MSTRFWIAALIYPMVNAVFFGTTVIVVLTLPALSDHAPKLLIPAAVISGLVLALPVSWIIAPRLHARYRRSQDRGGLLSVK